MSSFQKAGGTSFYGKETLALKKFLKWFGFLAAAGTAAGLIAAYVFKSRKDTSAENEQDCTEDEDYDLDADLKPAAEREYVSLNSKKAETPEAPEADKADEDEASPAQQ